MTGVVITPYTGDMTLGIIGFYAAHPDKITPKDKDALGIWKE